MTIAVILDIAIAAVLALFIFLGWKRGLFRSLAELAAVVLALVLAYQVADFAAGAIVERALRPAAHAAIETRVEELMAENTGSDSLRAGLERVLEALPEGYLRQQALALLEGLDLSGVDQAGASARNTLVDLGYTVADETLDTVVRGAIHGLVCALAFTVLLILLRLAVKALDLTTKLPLIHQLNGAGGALLGAAKGLILVCLAVWILRRTGVLPEETLERSFLAALAARVTGV